MTSEEAQTILFALKESASSRGQQPVRTWGAVVRRALQYTPGMPGARLRAADFHEAGAMTVRELIMLIAGEEEE